MQKEKLKTLKQPKEQHKYKCPEIGQKDLLSNSSIKEKLLRISTSDFEIIDNVVKRKIVH